MYMEYQDTRTNYGKFMFNFTVKGADFLIKHMWLYYILSYTWGIITTTIGWIVYLFTRIFLFKIIKEHGRFGPCCYVMLGNNWGGLEMGTTFLIADEMGDKWTLHTKCHECGHTFQNALLGPFAIFLSFIPSFIRYWYQTVAKKKNKKVKPYDQIWFEGSATTIGTNYCRHENKLAKGG